AAGRVSALAPAEPLGLRAAVASAGPVALASAVSRVNVLADRAVAAALLPTGGVAVLALAGKLVAVPQKLFGSPLASAAYPARPQALPAPVAAVRVRPHPRARRRPRPRARHAGDRARDDRDRRPRHRAARADAARPSPAARRRRERPCRRRADDRVPPRPPR